MDDVVVIGGDSVLGRAAAIELARRGLAVRSTSRRPARDVGTLYADLGDLTGLSQLPAARVWVVAAAMTNMAACENDPDASEHYNFSAVAHLAERARAIGGRVLLLSTSQVFDGTRPAPGHDEPPSPSTVYGRHKAAAEAAVLAQGGGVVRLTKVVRPDLPLFAQWRDRLLRGQPVAAFEDYVFSPVPLPLAATVIADAAQADLAGILQASGPRDISYAHAARRLADRLGVSPALVTACSAHGTIPGSFIGVHTTLQTSRLAQEFGITIPDADLVLDGLFAPLVEAIHDDR